MKKYLVIGNPIEHSLSPRVHNFWFKENNIKAIYEKKKLDNNGLKDLVLDLRKKKINGVNVTIPFKKEIIAHVNELSPESENTQSVNTIYLKEDKVIGHNTDIEGFELSVKEKNYDLLKKKILILGAGGVVPSIIFALKKMKVKNIIISNRTRGKAEDLKILFNDLEVIDWGSIPDVDMIINATSLGLKKDDEIDLDFSKFEGKKFFYDIIYNPEETNFLKVGKKLDCITENGKKMFIYQAAASSKIWHGIQPQINNELIKLLSK